MRASVKVAYILRSWPRLSQTFVLGEVLALEKLGVDISIFAMTKPDEPIVQDRVMQVRAPVQYLEDHFIVDVFSHARVATDDPRRYLATFLCALWRRDLRGGYTKSGPLAAFNKAVMIAGTLRAERRRGRAFTHIHAHFAHDPAFIGLLVHRLTGLPFSFTAHARDLYQIPEAALVGRAREASALVTCCRANVEHIESVLGHGHRPAELIYHGTDLEMFAPATARHERSAPVVVSVGRLVEKKGFDDLLEACALTVTSGRSFTCEIFGDGPCRSQLERLRDQLGLGSVVFFRGERTQVDLVRVYQEADIFALTPRVTEDGDRDGVPNVLVEAMACGLPVVSTDAGGVAELVAHGSNGLLAPSHDIQAIAANLAALLDDLLWRRRLGKEAAATAEHFDSRTAAQRLAALFGHDEMEPS